MLQWTEHPSREEGMTITVDVVKGFLKQMDEDDEFDACELDIGAFAAIACGKQGKGRGVADKSKHDEL